MEDKKGFSIAYGLGDFCSDGTMTQRQVKFDFTCDPNVDFEIRSMKEEITCSYVFKIYAKEACRILSQGI